MKGSLIFISLLSGGLCYKEEESFEPTSQSFEEISLDSPMRAVSETASREFLSVEDNSRTVESQSQEFIEGHFSDIIEERNLQSIEEAERPREIKLSKENAIVLPWMPTGIVMSDNTLVSMEMLWKSVENLWRKRTGELASGASTVVPTGIVMHNGDTVPLDNFWGLMDKIFAQNKSGESVPKFKAIPAMTRDADGTLVYPDGSPVALPDKEDKEWPVVGWKQADGGDYIVSLINYKGEINEVDITPKDFEDLLNGKNVALEGDGVVGAQFAGGYKMYGYPGMFGCPYYAPCSPMYGMHGGFGHQHQHNSHFSMSSSGSSGFGGGMGYYPY